MALLKKRGVVYHDQSHDQGHDQGLDHDLDHDKQHLLDWHLRGKTIFGKSNSFDDKTS